MRIAVATCAAAPRLDEDRDLLLPALVRAGSSVEPVVWNDPAVGWSDFDGVLVRSVWDYPAHHAAFLEWLADGPPMVNPRSVLTWNSDKHYLQDLTSAGVAVVPTVFLPPGEVLEPPGTDFVVKPAIGGSAADSGRFRVTPGAAPGDAGAEGAAALVERLHRQGRDVLVQPYLDQIEDAGETSLVYLGGRYSHAVRREALLTRRGERRPVVVADVLRTVRAAAPTPAERTLADDVLAAVPGGGRLGYARVDLIPGASGPLLLELEVVDCYLFLPYATTAAVDWFAEHVATEIDRGARSDGSGAPADPHEKG